MAGDVVPAIIPQSFEDLESKIVRVKDFVNRIQIDVFDGTFSPSKNWPYNDFENESFSKLKEGALQLPFFQDVILEIDVTLTDPEKHIEDWITAGARALLVHIEKVDDMEWIIDTCHARDVGIGIALSPQTPNEKVYPWAAHIDSVQFMGNQKVGYHGVDLNPEVLLKIREFRNTHKEIPVAVDIGVSLETAPDLVEAGATRLVSGSAIFNSEEPEKVIAEFHAMLKNTSA